MAATKIEWTDYTFNPWRGCTKVSPGCAHCYAERESRGNPAVLGTWGPEGPRVIAAESYWRGPLAWNREAERDGIRRRVFCGSIMDVFEIWDGDLIDVRGESLYRRGITLNDIRARLFGLIDATRHLDWMLLTKRPENIRRCWGQTPVSRMGSIIAGRDPGEGWAHRANVWLGTSAEDQRRLDERVPHLLRCPAAVRFLSIEPMLGPIELCNCASGLTPVGWHTPECPLFRGGGVQDLPPNLHWVIVGGESGPGARPMHPDWARSVRDQCQAAGVPFFFKQWGEWSPIGIADRYDYRDVPDGSGGHHRMFRVGKKSAGRFLDGREWNEVPGLEGAEALRH